ncbi:MULTISPECIES: alpha/beta hydrolase [unclassified Brevundimonas]|uniref:alpha/beta hydrolase n=1 Tax=unclassified Brevundimonas TaxID=2622653 RepID=UPI0025C36656|nr:MULTISPECIES: alpha/beta hydrolase [unclassified Brevundimonas]
MRSNPRITVVFLHSLGASRREWDDVIARFSDDTQTVAMDLPGFGDRAREGYGDVQGVLDDLCRRLADLDLGLWVIVGHSMGGKFATLIAARARDGAPGLSGLVGVVLVAGSPPSPEPMDEDRRAEMLTWFDDPTTIEDRARQFIDANTDAGLPQDAFQQALDDFRRSSPDAWRGWLAQGSREDWSVQAGVIPYPALIVAGAEDGDLGETAQRRCNAPHFRCPQVVVAPKAAHLIPQEQPEPLAVLIRDFAETAGGAALPDRFVRLMASERVSDRTRRAMLQRHFGPAPSDGGVLTPTQRDLLTAVIARILPDVGEPQALARRLDVGLASGQADGWRFADLPSDAEAWRRGLDTLAAMSPGFATLGPDRRDAILRALSTGDADVVDGPGRLSAKAMKLWFEDVASDAARVWMSLPATWARIGYDGFATGGQDAVQGYGETAADRTESWRLPTERGR